MERINKALEEITEEMLKKSGYNRVQIIKESKFNAKLIADDLIITGDDEIINFLEQIKMKHGKREKD